MCRTFQLAGGFIANFRACLFERARGDWRARRRLGELRTRAPRLTDSLPLYGRSASCWTLVSRRLDVAERRSLFCPTHPPWCRARAVLARVQAADFGLQPRRSCQSIPLCYYRPRNCGGGCYARFYHHTIPEHSLDSASGYFAALRRRASYSLIFSKG